MGLRSSSIEFIKVAGEGVELTSEQIQKICMQHPELSYPFWLVASSDYRVSRGVYKTPYLTDACGPPKDAPEVLEESVVNVTVPIPEPSGPPPGVLNYVRMAKLYDESEPTVPESYSGFVPFGFFKDLCTLFSSKKFFPVMITGMHGNGKTLMVRQAAAHTKRLLIKVSISVETDQNDLLGGPILIDGNIVNRDGPVILAMKHGAILLLDETDRGSNKLLCLQSILDGEPYFNKNNGEMVYPKAGFNIVATANTKGRGSEDGKYLAQILDTAFLDRFPITIEQEYPNNKTETNILTKCLAIENLTEELFVKNLVTWASSTRKLVSEGTFTDCISTRRLVGICKAFVIYGDKKKAVTLCTHQFDDETKGAFLEYWSKISDVPETPPATESSTADIWIEEVDKDLF